MGLGVAAWAAVPLLAACAPGAAGGPPPSPALPILWHVARDEPLSWDALAELAAAHRYTLLGEVHDNPHHHRVQAELLRRVVAEGRRPALVLEMAPADRQEALARASADPGLEPARLRRALAWDDSGWPPWELYAPVFAAALDEDLPLVAGDLPRATLGALRRGGLGALPPARRRGIAPDLAGPAPEAQLRILGAAIRAGHCDLLPERAIPAMVDIQRARDAHLAAAMARAVRAGADGALLLAGAGHTRRDVAVPWWLRRLDPGGGSLSVGLVEVPAEALARTLEDPRAHLRTAHGGEAPAYDVVVLTEAAAREDPCARLRRRLAP